MKEGVKKKENLSQVEAFMFVRTSFLSSKLIC